MKLLFTTVLVLFCFAAVAQGNIFKFGKGTKSKSQVNSLKLDREYGFRGIMLESKLSSFNNMKLIQDEGNTKYYIRSTDELNINGIEVYSIKYCFYKNKLMMISITTNGLNNSQGLLDILQDQYGESPKSKSGSYFIMGEKVKLSFAKNPNTQEAKLKIMSLPLTYTMLHEEQEIKNDKQVFIWGANF
jgi:hypothetical protein